LKRLWDKWFIDDPGGILNSLPDTKGKGMNTTQRVVKNTFALLAGNLLASGLGFVTAVYVARILGPGDFGRINFATAIVAYFMLLTNIGLPLLGIREIAGETLRIKEYLGQILTLRFVLAVLSFLLLAVLALFLPTHLEIKWLLLLYGIGVIPSALMLDWLFQGVERMEYIGLAQIIASLFTLTFTVIFIKGSHQLLAIPVMQVLGNCLAVLFLMAVCVRHYKPGPFIFCPRTWWPLLMKAFPIGFSLIMAQIFYNIDSVMLGFMRTNEELGTYNAAYKVIFLCIIIVGAYHDATFPVLSNYFKTSRESLKALVSFTERLMVMIAIPLALSVMVLAKPIMTLVYGVAYTEAAVPFRILIWAVFILYINTAYSRGVLACKQTKWFLAGVTVPAIVNILSNCILIPPMGIAGAAIATVLAEASGFCIMYSGFQRITRVSILPYVVKPLSASAVMLVFLYGSAVFTQNLFVRICGSVVVYAAFLYLLKEITRDDLDQVYRLIFASSKKDGV